MPSTRKPRETDNYAVTANRKVFLFKPGASKGKTRPAWKPGWGEAASGEELFSYILTKIGTAQLNIVALNVGSQEDADRIAERIEAVLPTKNPVAEAIGPVFDTPDLVEWLGVTRQAVHARAQRHTMVAVKTSDGPTVFPEWQFAADGTVLPGVADALRALAAGGMDDATNAMWFTGDNPDLDEMSAAQWLAERRDPAVVTRSAKQTASRWRQ